MHFPFRTHRILSDRGVGLIEAVVVVSIMSTAFAGLLGSVHFFLKSGLLAARNVQALFLLNEGVEVVRHLRDASFTTHLVPHVGAGARYLEPTGSGWTITTTDTPILGSFSRTVTIDQVYRRTSDNDIVPSGSADPKTSDPHTLRVTVTVSSAEWSDTVVTYVADLYEN